MWDARDVAPCRRYAYNYSPDELAEWAPKIPALHADGKPVHVLMNNCWRGFAVRNVHTLAHQLAQEPG